MNFYRAIKIFLVVLIGLSLVNLIFLNYKVFFERKQSGVVPTGVYSEKPVTVEEKTLLVLPTEAIIEKEEEACPKACLKEISQLMDEITEKAKEKSESQVVKLGVKEFYIPFGSGSTKSQDWVELPGVEAVIDSANFPDVKSIIFEAILRIPSANGRVYAKIYDVTSKHDVWFSEVWGEGPTSYRAESVSINLSSGRNLYRVMMKSTMGYEAILDLARLKIILK